MIVGLSCWMTSPHVSIKYYNCLTIDNFSQIIQVKSGVVIGLTSCIYVSLWCFLRCKFSFV
jgi:hypothetical protein